MPAAHGCVLRRPGCWIPPGRDSRGAGRAHNHDFPASAGTPSVPHPPSTACRPPPTTHVKWSWCGPVSRRSTRWQDAGSGLSLVHAWPRGCGHVARKSSGDPPAQSTDRGSRPRSSAEAEREQETDGGLDRSAVVTHRSGSLGRVAAVMNGRRGAGPTPAPESVGSPLGGGPVPESDLATGRDERIRVTGLVQRDEPLIHRPGDASLLEQRCRRSRRNR